MESLNDYYNIIKNTVDHSVLKDLISLLNSDQMDQLIPEELELLKNIRHILYNINDEHNSELISFVINRINELLRLNIHRDEEEQEDTPIRERTDKSLIPDSDIRVVQDGLDIMNFIVDEEKFANIEINKFFNNQFCDIVNKSLKNKQNVYTLDRLGIVIRKKSYNKPKDPFSWKYNDKKEPISYYTKELVDDDENIKNILNVQFKLKPTLFNKKGIITKIYNQDQKLMNRITEFIHSEEVN